MHDPDRRRVEQVVEFPPHRSEPAGLDLYQFATANQIDDEPIQRDLHLIAIDAIPLLESRMQRLFIEDANSRHLLSLPPRVVSGSLSICHNPPMKETPALSDPRLRSVDHEVIRHEGVKSLDEAALHRGVDPSAVIKTMVVRRDEDDYVFVLVPGDRVIDWSKLRKVLKQRRLSMPDAEEALSATGYVRGTITPFGSSHDWPVFADERLSEMKVSIGGGARGVSITTKGVDVIRALDASVADLTKRRN